MEPGRSPRPAPLSANGQGALWVLLSVAGATVMTIGVRQAAQEIHTVMLAFVRSVLALLPVLPLLARVRFDVQPAAAPARKVIRFTAWKLHLFRGLALVGALNGGFYAIWQLPIATASILFFLAPVFATALAGPILGETVGIRRWLAVLTGFGGAIIILRPGLQPIDDGMLAAVGSALCYSAVLVAGRLATDRDGTDAVFVSSSVIAAVMTLPPALFFWAMPTAAATWLLIAIIVAASSLRSYSDIRAYAVGDASFLAPFNYLRLVTVGIAGYLLFGETIDTVTALGGAVIIGSTLYIALREARLNRRLGGAP